MNLTTGKRDAGDESKQRGQCILFSVVFTPPPPATTPVFGLLPVISLLLTITLYRRCGLAYPYDWRGFVRAKKETSVGLSEDKAP
jgi:hypothetical protein